MLFLVLGLMGLCVLAALQAFRNGQIEQMLRHLDGTKADMQETNVIRRRLDALEKPNESPDAEGRR
jgi:hypothetical protein